MGDDGHTLSLFPGYQVIHEQQHWVTSFYVPDQQIYRITLTASIVNLASRIAFLATGEKKANTLVKVLRGNYDPEKFPSQIIKPVAGELHWFVDEAAASLL
jgi:6-phosphogluconolactonase